MWEAAFWVAIVLGTATTLATYLSQHRANRPRKPKGRNDFLGG